MSNPVEYWALDRIFDTSPHRFFRVPEYQRGYTWEDEDQVKALWDDLKDAFENRKLQDYLLGQIILSPTSEKPGYQDIVDGQQRVTTCYLLLIAAHHIYVEAESELETSFKQKWAGFTNRIWFPVAQNDLVTRIQLSQDGNEVVRQILFDLELPDENATETSTQLNLVKAFNFLMQSFKRDFDADPDKVFDFVSFLLNKVHVVSLSVQTTEEALRIFARTNNRGMSLDDADLIKNLLFQKVSARDYEYISERWNDAAQKIFSTRLKRTRSMNFLLKNLIGIRTGESIRNDDLFRRWELEFRDPDSSEDTPTDSRANREPLTPRSFSEMLPKKAGVLVKISKGERPQGGFYKDNQNGIYAFSYVQPYEVLLAADEKDEETFDIVASVVEARTMLSLLAEEKTQDYERMVHKWAQKISGLPYSASLDEVLKASEEPWKANAKLLEAMQLNIRRLRYNIPGQQKRIRYVLAKVAAHLQQDVFKITQAESTTVEELMSTSKAKKGESSSKTGLHLEHIFPKSQKQKNNFDKPEAYDLIESIGNLTLLNPFDNSAVTDMLPEEKDKQQNFIGSHLYLNKLLMPLSKLETNVSKVQLEKFIAEKSHLKHDLDDWGHEAITSRTNYVVDTFTKLIQRGLGSTSEKRS